jgi:hypothetical protein
LFFYTYQVHPTGTGTDPIALAALIVAVVAAVFAGVSVYWAHSEHIEFLKRLRARAKLRVQLTAIENPAPGTDDPLAVAAEPGHEFDQIFRIGIANDGDSAAGATSIDVLVPATVRNFEWCDGAGRPLDQQDTPIDTGEKLPRESGEAPAIWISKEIRRVSTRGGVVCHFKLLVDRNERCLPIRIKAQCDELPDDIEEECQDFELKVCDPRPPYGLRKATP